MSFVIDVASCAGDPGLAHLRSFRDVEGLTIEDDIALVEGAGSAAAVMGPNGSRIVRVSPLTEYRELAANVAAESTGGFAPDVIERALVFAALARKLNADAVVSPARAAFGPRHYGLLGRGRLISVTEALAMLGACVRQRASVPLAGTPPFLTSRTEVYPLTGRLIIPHCDAWWAACVHTFGASSSLVELATAVFKRLGQSLRGRDGVHESLRTLSGRDAIIDSLYHLDVVLTSAVGALDALARFAHIVFGLTPSKIRDAGWHRDKWLKELRKVAGTLGGTVASGTARGTAVRIVTKTRNSIHGIPLDEYLHVAYSNAHSVVEHRAVISNELRDELLCEWKKCSDFGPLESSGLFLDSSERSFLHVGKFAEQVLIWSIDTIGTLMADMLLHPEFRRSDVGPVTSIEQLQAGYCVALAGVGNYPELLDATGVPAAPSVHGEVMSIIRAHRKR